MKQVNISCLPTWHWTSFRDFLEFPVIFINFFLIYLPQSCHFYPILPRLGNKMIFCSKNSSKLWTSFFGVFEIFFFFSSSLTSKGSFLLPLHPVLEQFFSQYQKWLKTMNFYFWIFQIFLWFFWLFWFYDHKRVIFISILPHFGAIYFILSKIRKRYVLD